jgi:hypothetical protein
MGESDGNDLAYSVRERDLVSDHRSQRQTSDEEDEHELEGGHLLSRAPANDANDKNQEKVAYERSHHAGHKGNLESHLC